MNEVVSTAWLAKHLYEPKVKIIKANLSRKAVKIPEKLLQYQIPGTITLDISTDVSDQEHSLPNMFPKMEVLRKKLRDLSISIEDHLVIYDVYGIYASPRLWWILDNMGFSQVSILDGGLPDWVRHKHPIEQIKPLSTEHASSLILENPKNYIYSAEQVLKAINQQDKVIIDARSSGRFNGTEPEPRAKLKSGHIPNSLNLPYTDVLKNGKLLPKKQLEAIFQPIANKKQVLIFTCGSGITACILLLAARVAGYEKLKIYDGSWTEWGQLTNFPVSK